MKSTSEMKGATTPEMAVWLAGGLQALGHCVTACVAALVQEARDDAVDRAECERIMTKARAEGWSEAQIIKARAGL